MGRLHLRQPPAHGLDKRRPVRAEDESSAWEVDIVYHKCEICGEEDSPLCWLTRANGYLSLVEPGRR